MAMSGGDEESDAIVEINITPFVDVVLVLLVIFMVATPLVVQQLIKVDLPKAVSSDTDVGDSLGLAVTRSGQFLLNGKLILTEDLKITLNQKFKTNPEATIILAGDLEAKHGDVVELMDIVKTIGFENIAFQVERQDASSQD